MLDSCAALPEGCEAPLPLRSSSASSIECPGDSEPSSDSSTELPDAFDLMLSEAMEIEAFDLDAWCPLPWSSDSMSDSGTESPDFLELLLSEAKPPNSSMEAECRDRVALPSLPESSDAISDSGTELPEAFDVPLSDAKSSAIDTESLDCDA